MSSAVTPESNGAKAARIVRKAAEPSVGDEPASQASAWREEINDPVCCTIFASRSAASPAGVVARHQSPMRSTDVSVAPACSARRRALVSETSGKSSPVRPNRCAASCAARLTSALRTKRG